VIHILSLIVSSIAGVFAGFLFLRFWMQVQRIRPPAQLAQAIFQLTDWIVHPIRIVPGYRGYDWASVIAVLLVALVAVSVTRCY
jgi:YggT family protein